MKGVEKRMPRLPSFRVQLRNLKGKAVFDLKGIPLLEMHKLAAALMAEFPAGPEAGDAEKTPLVG